MSLLTTATTVEDSFFDGARKAENVVLRLAGALAQGSERTTKRRREFPTGRVVPAPAEITTHAFDIVERLVANLRNFTSRLVTLAPSTAESRPITAQAASEAHVNVPPEVAAIIALAVAAA
jgi:hypothetical protein